VGSVSLPGTFPVRIAGTARVVYWSIVVVREYHVPSRASRPKPGYRSASTLPFSRMSEDTGSSSKTTSTTGVSPCAWTRAPCASATASGAVPTNATRPASGSTTEKERNVRNGRQRV
jgi:hypothetical protein